MGKKLPTRVGGKTDQDGRTCQSGDDGGKPMPLLGIYDDIERAPNRGNKITKPVIEQCPRDGAGKVENRRIPLFSQHRDRAFREFFANGTDCAQQQHGIADSSRTDEKNGTRFPPWRPPRLLHEENGHGSQESINALEKSNFQHVSSVRRQSLTSVTF